MSEPFVELTLTSGVKLLVNEALVISVTPSERISETPLSTVQCVGIVYEVRGAAQEIADKLLKDDVRYIPISIITTDTVVPILDGIPDKILRLVAMHVGTKERDADFQIDDSDSSPLTNVIDFGRSNNDKLDKIVWPFNPSGWLEAPVGKGLEIANLEGATIALYAVVRVVDP